MFVVNSHVVEYNCKKSLIHNTYTQKETYLQYKK